MALRDCLPAESWLRRWVEIWPHSEPPESYILFSAMAIMGGILGRSLSMQYDVHEIRPMLNLLLIGPSGIGKSTSVKMARLLLAYTPEERRPQFIEGGSTKEKLHADLVENPHAILFAPELAAFFSKEKYKEALIPYVTNLLDYEERIQLRTRKDNVTTVERPEVTILGASTREWLQEQLPDSAVSGGFLARFLLLLETQRGRKIPNPHRRGTDRSREALEAQRNDVMNQFGSLMVRALHLGRIDYEDYDAAEAYANWYLGYNPDTGLLSPFAARAGEMILRLAILIAVSCGRDGMSVADIAGAIHLYEYLAARLGEIVVPTTQAGKMLTTVLDAIPPLGIHQQVLYKALRHVAGAREISNNIGSLQASGNVRRVGDFLYPIETQAEIPSDPEAS